MVVSDQRVYAEAHQLLTQLYGENASFRDGQYEAIEAALTQHRSLVIQRTGWGKSLVYFLCTKILRSRNRGVTLVVSPLLVLMQNQLEAAEKLGLACAQLNSKTKDSRDEILDDMVCGRLDLVFITPETLFSKKVQEKLPQISIGLFVIDEAHCISDWGHDFRLEYGQLREIIRSLPANVPILGTTATANGRVIADLQEQLGSDVFVSRGPLARDSLHLQVLSLEGQAERYGWILENLKNLPGSGIIYCLTQRDCDMLAGFLTKHGISAAAYHSGLSEDDNQETEERFRNNEIKAIVATIKLGMGYDKDDISFVIHFQMPSNIVSYYQQIGRAGRNIPQANVFLMSGVENEEINEYFIESAFPTREEMDSVMECIRNAQADATPAMLASALNMRKSRLDKALMFLYTDGYIYIEREPIRYFVSPKPYRYQGERYQQIRDIRRREMGQMKELVHTRECLSKFIVRHLDDQTARDCGHCVNCTGKELLPGRPSRGAVEKAQHYLNNLLLPIEPRKRWPSGVMSKAAIEHVNKDGLCLSKYGDAGFGQLVKEGKYSSAKRFSDELVEKSAQVLAGLIEAHSIEAVTCVPSLRSDLVENFAGRLAARLGLPFVPLLRKSSAQQQKTMENSAYQCRNALESFSVKDGVQIPSRVLLVDDVVDSGWTLTVCGYRLMEEGCEEVYPFALADSSHSG